MAKSILLDASAWLAVLLNESGSDRLADILQKSPLVSTELIRYEVANGLVQTYRRRRIPSGGKALETLLRITAAFPIEIAANGVWWREAVRLVHRHPLTFYDASYLACAIELRLPLLTLDTQMLQAMKEEKVPGV